MMDVVSHCVVCGSPVLGTFHRNDIMADVFYMTCSCGTDDDNDLTNDDNAIRGSGDFDHSNCYGGGE